MKNKIIAILFIIVLALWIMTLGIVLIANIHKPRAQALPEAKAQIATQEQINEIEQRFNKPKPKLNSRDDIMKSETTFPSMTKAQGVNCYSGYTQTWYSSNILRHKDIRKWHTDSHGYWRDADGYIVVAYAEGTEGSIIPIGDNCWGKVLDVCPEGNVDLYVNW